MSRPAPRRIQNHQPSIQNPPSHSHSHSNSNSHLNPNDLPEHNNHLSHPHGHGHGHRRTRSRQLQDEARRQQQNQRQPHHQHHHQQQQQTHPPVSDYESDTPQYMAPNTAVQPAALAGRTNPELNLGVLRRYLPSITSVLSIAANAVVYTFQSGSQWKRTTMEGTMFICSQRKAPGEVGETGCLFILNRKGLQNFVLDLDNVGNFELAGGLLIFKLDYAAHELHLESGEAVTPQVLGLWTYAEDESDRETNATLITDMWSQALSTRDARAQAAASDPVAFVALESGPAAQATGRRLSVSDLFSGFNGNSIPAQGPS
ncbi:PH domain-like protein [Xylaria bambusicola]|uniref:PH domain-like protein n=1 Tax=Xylaria bambusicola TaxID=326684 RepID=UPI002007C317|nr:PH domain-like protein [Xylaria bambusicola]KAI0517449.1 PH domain-like protein [Xylaria bambusicola]